MKRALAPEGRLFDFRPVSNCREKLVSVDEQKIPRRTYRHRSRFSTKEALKKFKVVPLGLKPALILFDLMYELKPVPFKAPTYSEVP
jgi:hypothetical protein